MIHTCFAFQSPSHLIPLQRTVRWYPKWKATPESAEEEAEALLEKARKIREEIAAMSGTSLQELEAEAAVKRQQRAAIEESSQLERQERQRLRDERKKTDTSGRMNLQVPETPDDQVWQAKAAIERAFKDGLTRQIIRLALVPENERLNFERLWPGGARQIYREAVGPLTREILKQVKAPTKQHPSDESSLWTKKPVVKSQDIWDFDGSALITAEHESPSADVQALVLPNTDDKYTKDIATIDQAMGDRLFLLVNPFWRNLDSWGINILAPGAKNHAQKVIFERGFTETYCVIQKSVRSEDCVAIKAYPYDWQLFAYRESDEWPSTEYCVHLGSTEHEPKSEDFVKLLEQREEFKLTKNMRQMQRMMNK
jgi:hypothetical protein